jgi:hypothetical protein
VWLVWARASLIVLYVTEAAQVPGRQSHSRPEGRGSADRIRQSELESLLHATFLCCELKGGIETPESRIGLQSGDILPTWARATFDARPSRLARDVCQSARKRDPQSASKRDPFRCGLYEAAMFLCSAGGGRFFAPA